MTSTNLNKKINLCVCIDETLEQKKIVQFLFSFAETFCCSKFPHLFLCGLATKQKRN